MLKDMRRVYAGREKDTLKATPINFESERYTLKAREGCIHTCWYVEIERGMLAAKEIYTLESRDTR